MNTEIINEFNKDIVKEEIRDFLKNYQNENIQNEDVRKRLLKEVNSYFKYSEIDNNSNIYSWATGPRDFYNNTDTDEVSSIVALIQTKYRSKENVVDLKSAHKELTKKRKDLNQQITIFNSLTSAIDNNLKTVHETEVEALKAQPEFAAFENEYIESLHEFENIWVKYNKESDLSRIHGFKKEDNEKLKETTDELLKSYNKYKKVQKNYLFSVHCMESGIPQTKAYQVKPLWDKLSTFESALTTLSYKKEQLVDKLKINKTEKDLNTLRFIDKSIVKCEENIASTKKDYNSQMYVCKTWRIPNNNEIAFTKDMISKGIKEDSYLKLQPTWEKKRKAKLNFEYLQKSLRDQLKMVEDVNMFKRFFQSKEEKLAIKNNIETLRRECLEAQTSLRKISTQFNDDLALVKLEQETRSQAISGAKTIDEKNSAILGDINYTSKSNIEREELNKKFNSDMDKLKIDVNSEQQVMLPVDLRKKIRPLWDKNEDAIKNHTMLAERYDNLKTKYEKLYKKSHLTKENAIKLRQEGKLLKNELIVANNQMNSAQAKYDMAVNQTINKFVVEYKPVEVNKSVEIMMSKNDSQDTNKIDFETLYKEKLAEIKAKDELLFQQKHKIYDLENRVDELMKSLNDFRKSIQRSGLPMRDRTLPVGKGHNENSITPQEKKDIIKNALRPAEEVKKPSELTLPKSQNGRSLLASQSERLLADEKKIVKEATNEETKINKNKIGGIKL